MDRKQEKIRHIIIEMREMLGLVENEVNELCRIISINNNKSVPLNVSRRITDCTLFLQDIWKELKKRYESMFSDGRRLKLSCTYRPPEEQFKLFLKGRDYVGNIIDKSKIVTYCDGKIKKSPHNYYPSYAFDCFVELNNQAIWDKREYQVIGKICQILGVRWGGNFSNLYDVYHIEDPDYEEAKKKEQMDS